MPGLAAMDDARRDKLRIQQSLVADSHLCVARLFHVQKGDVRDITDPWISYIVRDMTIKFFGDLNYLGNL